MPPYEPLHPSAYRLAPSDLDPDFLTASQEASPGAWKALLEPLTPGVQRLRVLSPSFCQRLDQEVAHLERWHAEQGIELVRPNSMNEYGVVLDDVGFRPMLQRFMLDHLRPLAAHLHPELGADELDDHHGFLVDYARDKDQDLGFHVDDSEVTLNLCLACDASGSELFVRGRRCSLHRQTPSRPSEEADIEHEPGVAIVHAGKERHGVQPLLRGQRRNLILWCRSSSHRASLGTDPACPTWCGARQSF